MCKQLLLIHTGSSHKGNTAIKRSTQHILNEKGDEKDEE
jgi:hypothetical protein